MNDKNEKICSTQGKLIFACSGAADVGEIADRAARQMTQKGHGKMFCLAGVGGRVEPIMKTTAAADRILALDGCSLDCVKKSLEQAGIQDYVHLRVTDMGMEKSASPATEDRIEQVAQKATELID